MTTRRKEENRLIGAFGKREMELAACRVMDAGWRTPLDPFVVWNLDETELRGLRLLESGAWLTIETTREQRPIIVKVARQFWEKIYDLAGRTVHDRLHR